MSLGMRAICYKYNMYTRINKRLTEDMRFLWKNVTLVEGPPAPGIWCGDSDYTWVSGWYPAATELNILKKAYTSQNKLVSF